MEHTKSHDYRSLFSHESKVQRQMPMTTIRHHDVRNLLPINTGKASVLTTWLPHAQRTKGIGTSRAGPTNSGSSGASRHRHHRHCAIPDCAGLPVRCSRGMDSMSPGLNYIAGKGLKFKWLFCIWINVCSFEPKYLPLIFPPISGAVRYTK